MTNNVDHRLHITGRKDELERFIKTCFIEENGNLEFDFNALIPMPKILNNTLPDKASDISHKQYKVIEDKALKQCGYKSWYEWRRVNWETKWNAYFTNMQASPDGALLLEFQTAWSCPEPIFDKIAELFPSFECHGVALDECCCFGAEIKIVAGSVSIQYESDVSLAYIDKIG